MLTLADVCASLSDDPGRDMDAHLLVLYSIARFLPATRLTIEIGTDDGSSTMPLLLGTAQMGGRVLSIDPAPCPTAHARVQASGYAAHWEHRQARSIDAAVRVEDVSVDLLLIDGDHSPTGVRTDWCAYERKVRRGGIILFHDALNARDFPGIAELINKEIRPYGQRWECATLPWGWGLTVVVKQ
jgi:predicted O-methyltransferase YrrM